MPISLSTFASGAVISAAELRVRSLAIENYVNGQIAAGDRTTNWMESGHVYEPDFQYARGYDARLPLAGGQMHWSQRPSDDGLRAIFSWRTGEGGIMVPGLTRTVQLPEGMASRYRALVLASFWVYEYGGEGGGTAYLPYQDEVNDRAAIVQIYDDGVPVNATARSVYTASCATDDGWQVTGAANLGASSGLIYCRKQVSMVYAASWLTAGVHTVGVAVRSPTPAADEWKHLFVREGSFYVRYRIR